MKDLETAIRELSDLVDSRIGVFAWREIIRPRMWGTIISIKTQVYLVRIFGLDQLVAEANRSERRSWLNPLKWPVLMGKTLFTLATRQARMETAEKNKPS